MHRYTLPAALVTASLLGACATVEDPPLTLTRYDGTPAPDAACLATMAQAAQRQAAGGFSTVARPVSRIVGPGRGAAVTLPGAARQQAALVPAGSHPVELPMPAFDNTFTLMYVNCTTRQAWFSRRGGAADVSYWFGPFAL